MKNNDLFATLNLDNTSYQLPIISPQCGQPAIDIQTLNQQTGYFTYDQGFKSTASCQSGITFIDGDKGILLYRGYPIEELAKKSNFLETSYLLLNGELPQSAELEEFTNQVKTHTMVHEQLIHFLSGFRRDAHPMAILCGVVGALASFYHDVLDIHNQQHREIAALRLIAKMPTLAAMSYKYSIGHPFVCPRNDLSYVENFLSMMFTVPAEDYTVNPVFTQALETIFILHADHEQNASTSTVRLAGSSGANPFACIAAGIAALWGPAHGGANEAVLKMLHTIGKPSNIKRYIEKAKDKNDPFKLMGFGHRVYKNFDPRAKILKECSKAVLKELKKDNPLFEIALLLEEMALKDEYFIEKKLYPNVDFYSGIILEALCIPTNMFTVIFALSRTVGWISHWKEMIEEPKLIIGRPRQIYTGHKKRLYPQ